MQLNKVFDPRDAISRLTRTECAYWARYYGLKINPDLPQVLQAEKLRASGKPGIRSITERGLGHGRAPLPPYDEWVRQIEGRPSAVARPEEQEVREIDALAALEAQYADPEPEPEKPAMPDMSEAEIRKNISKLRSACKQAGIDYPRNAKALDLWELLKNGANAS